MDVSDAISVALCHSNKLAGVSVQSTLRSGKIMLRKILQKSNVRRET